LRFRQNREAGERERRERGIDNIAYSFHVLVSFHCFSLVPETGRYKSVSDC
jgi:hypothetical protein